jgi:hypothetical protein
MSEPQGGYNAPIQFEVTTPEERAKKPPARGMNPAEVQAFLDKPIQGLGSFRGVPDAPAPVNEEAE